MAIVTDNESLNEGIAHLRLLQLASPALPIGAFAYSQGLESAVAAGLVSDEASASGWILGLLAGPLTQVDLAVFARMHAAFTDGDFARAQRWNAFLLASRATAELQAEDRHLGAALARVLSTLGMEDPVMFGAPSFEADDGGAAPVVRPRATPAVARTFARMFALATARWRIDARRAAQTFAFTWAEAQTSAAVRLVPLGQSAGVRLLADAARAIPATVERALQIADDEIGAATPQQALLSSAHETQYSRLFRS